LKIFYIAVKEQAVTRRHLGIDQIQLFEHLIHTLLGAYKPQQAKSKILRKRSQCASREMWL